MLPGENPAAATPAVVDQEDYDFWVVNVGATLGSETNEVAAVPEPATIALGAFYAIVSLLLNQSRRSGCA